MGKFLTLLLILICIHISACFNFRQVVVSASSYKIRNYATYTFLLSRNADNNFNQTQWNTISVPAGSNITIQFPPQYSSSNIALCSCPSIIINTNTTNSPAMTISGNTVTISNTITAPSFISSVQIVLTNIKNPQPAIKTSSFVGTIGVDVAQPALNANVLLQMNNLASCSAIFSKGFVNTYDNLTISLTSLAAMASDNIVQVTFPSSYQAAVVSKPIGVNKTMTCLTSLGISGVYCNANSSNANIVTVYNTFSSNATALSTNFQINGILVPPTIQAIDTIKIATYTSAGVGYDQCTVSFSNLNPLVMTSLFFATSTTITVNKIFTTNITIPLITSLYSSDYIIVTMPSQYSPVFKLQGITGFAVNSSGTSVTGCIVNTNTSLLLNFSTVANINVGSTLLVILSVLFAPPSSGITPTFSVSLYQAGYLKCTGSATLNIYPNTITSIQTSASNPIIGVISPYSITYLSADPIPSSGMIRILFPSTIAVSSSISQVAINGNSVSFSLLPAFNGVLLTNLISMSANAAIKITINSIKNPSTSDPITAALALSTYYTTSTADLVAAVSYVPVELTYTGPQTINYLVYSSSDVVAATNVSLLFAVSTQLGISSGGSISIAVNEMASSIASTSCRLEATNVSIVYPCSINSNGTNNIVTISNISSQLGTAFNITIANAFTNPPSTYPQAYFTIITYSQLGTQNERTSPISFSFLTISKPASFISFTVSRTSARNSEKSNYTFALRQNSVFLTDATAINSLMITFPTEISLASASCSSCAIDTTLNNITVTLDNSVLANATAFSVTVNNIMNAPSLQPPSHNITAITILNTNYNYSFSKAPDNYMDTINSLPSDIVLTNTTSFSTMMVGQQNSLNVAIISSNTYAQYYILSLNSQFIGLNITCSIPANYTCTFNSPLGYVLINKTSPSVPFPSTLAFTVSGFSNPVISSSQSLSSSLSGYSNKYLVNQYNGSYLSWSPGCNFPCLTCTSLNKSLCLTCITNTSLSSFIYYYAAKQVCLSVCYSTQVLISGQCIDCTNNCMECVGTTSRCTACNTSTPFAYFYNFTCLNASSCPSSYYPDPTYNCLSCLFPCLTCVNSSQCITCAVGAFWLNTNCVSTCPYNSTIANSANKTCDPCSPICASCLGSVGNCSTCGSGTVKFNGSCLQNCTAPYYVYVADCVPYCVAPCLTCQVMATYCRSCLTNTTQPLFLYLGQCLTSCPSLFVINLNTHNCDSCSSLNINCSYCSSNNNCSFFGGTSNCSASQYYSCIKCDFNFTYYFNSLLGVYQCVTSLPDGYVSINYLATLCDPSCLTCANFTTSCIYCSSLYLFNGLCASSCLDGYFPASINVLFNSANRSTLVCLPCQGNCLACLNQTQCLSCKNSTYYNGNYSCIAAASCPLFTYGNDTYWNCTACSSPCSTCYSYSGCNTCLNNFYFYLGACISTCPSGLFQDSSNNSCNSCNTECSTCQLSSSICTGCANSYYLYSYNNSCLSSCPTGFTINYNLQICQNCTLPCLECAQTACFRCTAINATIYYIFQQVCISSCPDGYFANNDPLSYSCVACNFTCTSCTNGSLCIACAAGYSELSSGICVDQCPSYQPIRKNVNGTNFCLHCTDANCALCTPTDICLQCNNYTLVLLQGLCSTTCPSNLIKIQNITSNSATCVTTDPNNPEVVFIEGQTLVLPINYPCCYIAAVFCCLALFIKFFQFCCMGNRKVLLFPLLSAALAIPQMCATYLAAFTYFLMRFRVFLRGPLSWDVFIYLFATSIVVQIGIGLYTLIVQTKIQWGDSVYTKWTKCANCVQKLYQYSVNLLTILNFKISHCLWCGIKSLPMLETSNKLVFYNRPSGLAALVSLTITADSILVLYFHPELAVIYYDIIIVIAVSLLFSLLALRRPYDFFIRHLEADPSLPLNRRVAQSQNYLIDGLHPIKTYDEDYDKKKIKKSISSSLLDDSNSSRSSQSSFNPLSSQRSSVRLQNMSIQYSNQRSSDKFSNRVDDSIIWQSQTLGTASVFVNPAGISSLENALLPKQNQAEQHERQQSQSAAQITENLIQTNMGILDIGEDESYSVQNDDSAIGKEVLPKQLKANYYDLQQCESAHYQPLQKSEESVYFTLHENKMRENSYSRQSPSASRQVPVDMSAYFKEKSVVKPQSFSGNILAASFDNSISINSNLSTAKKSNSKLIKQPSHQSIESHSQLQCQRFDNQESSINGPSSNLSQRTLKIAQRNSQQSSRYAMPNRTVREETIVNAKVEKNIEGKSSYAVNEFAHNFKRQYQKDKQLSNNSSQRSQFQLYSLHKFNKDSLNAQDNSKRSQMSIFSIQKSAISLNTNRQRQAEHQHQVNDGDNDQDVNVSADYSVQNANGSFDSSFHQQQHHDDDQPKQIQPNIQSLSSFYEQFQSENASKMNVNGFQGIIDSLHQSRAIKNKKQSGATKKIAYKKPSNAGSSLIGQGRQPNQRQVNDLSSFKQQKNQSASIFGQSQLSLQDAALRGRLNDQNELSYEQDSSGKQEQSDRQEHNMQDLSSMKASFPSKLVQNSSKISKKSSKQLTSSKQLKKSSNPSLLAADEQQLNEELSQHSHHSNIFNQSNLSNIISINNASNASGLSNSRHSLKRSRNSYGEEVPNESHKMKSSVKMKQQLEYYPNKEIISEEAQSVQFSEQSQNRQYSIQKYLTPKPEVVEPTQKNQPEQNEFRIRTKKKKNKEQAKSKEKVIYVEQAKFRSLKKEAQKIEKQVRINQKLQRTIQAEVDSSLHCSNMMGLNYSKSGSKQKRRESPTRIQQVYMNKPYNVLPPKQ